ncbi:MAG: FG-GAP repeat domain-containing protein [Candidatus Acidiferrales bacterium]
MLSKIHESFGEARAARRALLILCLVLGAAGRIHAAGTSTNHSPNSSPEFNSVFAIADFDGDRKPDLATVEIQNGNSSSATRYSIRFRMTAGAAQSFGVSAPAGGLQIVARDVNGDDALDLLVSTTWMHQQVAVLLNDGHGNFTLAKPGAFPALGWKSETVCESGAVSLCESAALLRSEYSAEESKAKNQFQCLQAQPAQDPLRVFHGKARLLLFSLLGRAPPVFVS